MSSGLNARPAQEAIDHGMTRAVAWQSGGCRLGRLQNGALQHRLSCINTSIGCTNDSSSLAGWAASCSWLGSQHRTTLQPGPQQQQPGAQQQQLVAKFEQLPVSVSVVNSPGHSGASVPPVAVPGSRGLRPFICYNVLLFRRWTIHL